MMIIHPLRNNIRKSLLLHRYSQVLIAFSFLFLVHSYLEFWVCVCFVKTILDLLSSVNYTILNGIGKEIKAAIRKMQSSHTPHKHIGNTSIQAAIFIENKNNRKGK